MKVQVDESSSVFGYIELSGAKNAALPILIAACLAEGDVIVHNVPIELMDIKVLLSILEEIGFDLQIDENKHIVVFHSPITCKITNNIPDKSNKIRCSLLLIPVILSICGEIRNLKVGGDKIGDRKHDIHVDLLRKMGASITESADFIDAQIRGSFIGNKYSMRIASTGATENAILAAVLAEGTTIIENANTRPEVLDLICFLNQMGAKIKTKTRYIEIKGVDKLVGTSYSIMNDAHEGISYAILAAMTRSQICLKNLCRDYVKEDIQLLRNIGVDIFEWNNDIYISAKDKELSPFSMQTAPYPGINSDIQPLLAALASTISGESIITDTRFESRFQYVDEFKKMGIDIVNYENCAIIQGGKDIYGADVTANDIRTGAALTFLGVVAKGATRIDNYYQTQRGYVNIVSKMQQIGVEIKIVED